MFTVSTFTFGLVCALLGFGLFILGLAFAGILAIKLWWKW